MTVGQLEALAPLLSHSPLGAVVFDLESDPGAVLWTNRSAVRLLGIGADRPLATLRDLAEPEDLVVVAPAWGMVLSGVDRSLVSDLRVVAGAGQYSWVRIHGHVIEDTGSFLVLFTEIPPPVEAEETVGAGPGDAVPDGARRPGAVTGGATMAGGGRRSAAAAGRRSALARDLAQAVADERLTLAYQPQLELETGRIVGVEALCRWFDDERGMVPPSVFIPVAEEIGLIADLGAWVMETACRQALAWQLRLDLPAPLRVAVNVSPAQFRGDLARMVTEVLRATGTAPETLALEVTEGMIMEDLEVTSRTLADLADRGVKVAVDDFGTGYCSLQYLRWLPVDQLKIDREFVRGLGSAPDVSAICSAVVALAHSLELDVVAEGVETESQFAELHRLGCEFGQGYLFGRPAPPEATESQVLRQNQAPDGRVGPLGPAGGRAFATALVVDDAPDVRQLAGMSLRATGYRALEVSSGAEALEIAATEQLDVVVLDITMPDMEGIEVCRRLRALPGGDALTIVMLTGHNDAGRKVAAFEAGADDYVVKPFSPRDLNSRVRAAMARSGGGAGPAWSIETMLGPAPGHEGQPGARSFDRRPPARDGSGMGDSDD